MTDVVADEIGALLASTRSRRAWDARANGSASSTTRIVPDIVTIAKGIASGPPVGDRGAPGTVGQVSARLDGRSTPTAARRRLCRTIATSMSWSSTVPANATRQGGQLLDFFRARQAWYPGAGYVRGKGLMCAIESVRPGTIEPDAAAAKTSIAEAAKRR